MLPANDINAQLTFTQLTVGGFGWIPNLTEVDASCILPVTLGVINLAIIEVFMQIEFSCRHLIFVMFADSTLI